MHKNVKVDEVLDCFRLVLMLLYASAVIEALSPGCPGTGQILQLCSTSPKLAAENAGAECDTVFPFGSPNTLNLFISCCF